MKYIPFLNWITFILFFIFIPISTNAQFSKNWSSWKEIHKDQNITVELKFYTPKPNSCIDNNKKFKFKYRVTGKYKRTPTYLNWKVSYFDCNGLRYYQQNALDLWKNKFHDISAGIVIEEADKQFTGKEIEKSFYEVKVSSSKQENSGLLPSLESTVPKSIKGLGKIFLGEMIDLEVTGGTLGEGAKWIWYKDRCGGQRIGEGKNVKLNILRKTTVFVRAEGKLNNTKCVQKTIAVDLRSTDPSSVSGTTDICKGTSTMLSVNGGTLGQNAQWVWYKDKCGATKVGTGPTINILPKTTARYYVRAEGKLNTTNCASVLVNVSLPVTAPDKIQISGSSSICQGESVKLRVGNTTNSSNYKWYSQSCGGTLVGSGTSITVRPNQATTYFVRAEGVCNKTICLSKRITVSKNSILPTSITVSGTDKNKVLRVSKNARLASGAKWKWYKDGCGAGSSIGSGPSINIKDKRKTATYFVKATGNCTTTNCTSITIKPEYNRNYIQQDFNTIHYGIGIGLEYNQIEDISAYSTNNIDGLTGLGIRGEAYFYPLMKKNFSLGVLSSFSVGASPYIFDGGNIPNTSPAQTDKYFYTQANIGVEAALGLSFLKILTRVNKEIQRNNLDRTIGNSTIAFDEELNREYVGIGIRLQPRNTNQNIDVLYMLYRNNQNEFTEFNNSFSDLGNQLAGFQISWKKQDKFTLRTNIYLPFTHQQLVSSNANDDKVSFYLSLLLNLDRFY